MRKRLSVVTCAGLLTLGLLGNSFAYNNPLLNKERVLRFDFTPDEIAQIGVQAKADFEKAMDKLLSVPASKRNFKNTVEYFEGALSDYRQLSEAFGLYIDFLPEAALRTAATNYKNDAQKYLVDVFTNKEIYRALKEYADKKEKLPVVEARLLDNFMTEFKRNGLALSEKDLAKFKKYQGELIDLKSKFSENLNQIVDKVEFTREELDGLSDDFIESLDKTKDGKYIVTTGTPHYYPFMDSVKNENARKKLEFAYHNRAAKQNVPLLEKALKIRVKLAKLLGYETWADYAL
jgi:Zn-dependent oligopeptidase